MTNRANLAKGAPMSEVTQESAPQDRLELEARFKVRSPLRCDGVGSLECAEEVESGRRMAIRWMPLDANGEIAAKTVEKLPVHPTLPRIRGSGRVGDLRNWSGGRGFN